MTCKPRLKNNLAESFLPRFPSGSLESWTYFSDCFHKLLFCPEVVFFILSVDEPPHNTDPCKTDGELSALFVITIILRSDLVFCLSECQGSLSLNKTSYPEPILSRRRWTIYYTQTHLVLSGIHFITICSKCVNTLSVVE